MKNELLSTVLKELKSKKSKSCGCEDMEESIQSSAKSIKSQTNRFQHPGANMRNKCGKFTEGSELHQQCIYDVMNQGLQEVYKAAIHETVSKRIISGQEDVSEDVKVAELIRGVKDLHGLIASYKSIDDKKKAKKEDDDDEENGDVNEQMAPPKSGKNIGISQRGKTKGKRVADVAAPLPGTPEYDNNPEVYNAMQSALNVAGAASGIGIPADLVATGHSLYHGKYGDAALNLAGVLPGVGEAKALGGVLAAGGAFGRINKGAKSAKPKKLGSKRPVNVKKPPTTPPPKTTGTTPASPPAKQTTGLTKKQQKQLNKLTNTNKRNTARQILQDPIKKEALLKSGDRARIAQVERDAKLPGLIRRTVTQGLFGGSTEKLGIGKQTTNFLKRSGTGLKYGAYGTIVAGGLAAGKYVIDVNKAESPEEAQNIPAPEFKIPATKIKAPSPIDFEAVMALPGAIQKLEVGMSPEQKAKAKKDRDFMRQYNRVYSGIPVPPGYREKYDQAMAGKPVPKMEKPIPGKNIGISQRGPNKGKRIARADLPYYRAAPLPGTPAYAELGESRQEDPVRDFLKNNPAQSGQGGQGGYGPRDVFRITRADIEQAMREIQDERTGRSITGAFGGITRSIFSPGDENAPKFSNAVRAFLKTAKESKSPSNIGNAIKQYEKKLKTQIANYKTPDYVTTRSEVMNPSRFNKPGRRK